MLELPEFKVQTKFGEMTLIARSDSHVVLSAREPVTINRAKYKGATHLMLKEGVWRVDGTHLKNIRSDNLSNQAFSLVQKAFPEIVQSWMRDHPAEVKSIKKPILERNIRRAVSEREELIRQVEAVCAEIRNLQSQLESLEQT